MSEDDRRAEEPEDRRRMDRRQAETGVPIDRRREDRRRVPRRLVDVFRSFLGRPASDDETRETPR